MPFAVADIGEGAEIVRGLNKKTTAPVCQFHFAQWRQKNV
jgi:hypothetical protein